MTPYQLDVEIARVCVESYDRATFEDGNSAVLIKESRDHMFICPRGTNDPMDFLHDILAVPWKPKVLGHWTRLGFWQYTEPLIEVALNRAMMTEKKVVLGGHSLGGTASELLGVIFTNRNIPIERMTTFGSPKTGWKGIGKVIRSIAGGRYVRDGDSVATVPWTGTHCRMERPLPGNPAIIGDHSMPEYLEELLKQT